MVALINTMIVLSEMALPLLLFVLIVIVLRRAMRLPRPHRRSNAVFFGDSGHGGSCVGFGGGGFGGGGAGGGGACGGGGHGC
jgi:uncharacterized membrane protein YgcG